MKTKYLLLLGLVALLAAACGPDMATPTPRAVPTQTPVAAPAPTEPVATAAAAAEPGGVEVALAAVKKVAGVLATVNGQEITWADYEPELRQALHSVTQQYGLDWNEADNIALLAGFQDQVLNTLISRTLLRQVAAREGLQVSAAELQARIDEQKAAIVNSGQFGSWEQFLAQFGLTEGYIARLLEDDLLIEKVSEAHPPAREVEQVHARHILVADEETAKQVLARLAAGEDWAALAAEYSQDTSNKDSGGDLGWFARGMMVPEFENAAFSLEPGTTSDPIQTSYGYHIVEVLEKGMREVDDDTYQSMVDQAFGVWLSEQQAAADIVTLVTFSSGE